MNALSYYFALPFIYLIAWLPFPVLYALSDFLYVILYYIIGYRRKIVMQNLKKSFPEKADSEIKIIEKKFYRHLCDLILETFKTLSFSKQEAIERCRPVNMEVVNAFTEKGQSVILVMGHYCNWEWGGNSYSISANHKLNVIYKELSNKHFDKLIYAMRSKFGTVLFEMKEVYKKMFEARNSVTATAFIADQTPQPDNAYWTIFLSQETPVFFGTEKIARKLNYPVIFVNIKKVKRGFYEMYFELLVKDPSKTPDGEITQAHTNRLEAEIKRQPEYWLWSHRRWKHRRPADKQINTKQY